MTRRVSPDVYGPAFCNSLAVRALAHLANAVRVAGDLTAAAAQWRQIHARIATEPLGDVDAEAEVACLEASLRLDQGRFDRAERLLGRARRRYRAAKDPEGLAKTLIKLAIAKRVQGQPSAGSEVKRLAAAISEIFAAQEVHAELARALTLSGLEVPLPALAGPRVAPFNRRHGGRGRTRTRPPASTPTASPRRLTRKRPEEPRSRPGRAGGPGDAGPAAAYQTSQRLAGFIGVPGAHWNAAAKAGLLISGPTARNCGGEWGSTLIRTRAASGVVRLHQTWPKATKNSWSLVRPGTAGSGVPWRASQPW